MGYIPRSIHELSSISDRAIPFLRFCGPRNHVREGSLELLNELVVWLLLRVVSVGGKKAISISYRSETVSECMTYLLRNIITQQC